MNSWIGNALFLAMLVASIAIRAPHDKRRRNGRVFTSRKGRFEYALLVGMAVGMLLLPLLSITPLLDFARHPLHPAVVGLGVVFAAGALWLFHRSHADLGTNWSPTLEIQDEHELITRGVYGSVRHPMYTSLFLMALAQACFLSNWIAGPGMLVAFGVMFASRLRTEERMMLETFGDRYREYRARTKRLIPGVW